MTPAAPIDSGPPRARGSGLHSIISTLTYDAADRLKKVVHADSADAQPGGDVQLASFVYRLDPVGPAACSTWSPAWTGSRGRGPDRVAAGRVRLRRL